MKIGIEYWDKTASVFCCLFYRHHPAQVAAHLPRLLHPRRAQVPRLSQYHYRTRYHYPSRVNSEQSSNQMYAQVNINGNIRWVTRPGSDITSTCIHPTLSLFRQHLLSVFSQIYPIPSKNIKLNGLKLFSSQARVVTINARVRDKCS